MEKNETFTELECLEIARVKKLTKSYFGKMVWGVLKGEKENSPELLNEMLENIFDSGDVEVKVQGEGNIQEGAAIYASNHATHSKQYNLLEKNPVWNYAPPHHMAELARRISALSGKQSQVLFSADNGIMKRLINVVGHIPVQRQNRRMRPEDREAVNNMVRESLDDGNNVLICPEGRFWGEMENNDVNNVGPIQKGVYHFAKENGVPVVPVISDQFCRAGNKEFGIEFKEAMRVGVDESAECFVRRLRQVYLDAGFTGVGDEDVDAV